MLLQGSGGDGEIRAKTRFLELLGILGANRERQAIHLGRGLLRRYLRLAPGQDGDNENPARGRDWKTLSSFIQW